MSVVASRLATALGRQDRSWLPDPDVPPNSMNGFTGGSVGVATGRSITPLSAMRLAAVYACQRVLADSVASNPLFGAQDLGGRIERIADADVPLLAGSTFVHGDGSPMETWDGMHRLVASMTARGTGFAYISAMSGRYATQLMPLHPDSVYPRPNKAATGWDWFVGQQQIDGERLVRIPLYTYDGPLGLGPLDAAIGAIDLGLAAQEFGARFFSNGATTSGVIEVAGDFPDEVAKQVAANWMATHGGINNANLPAVLTGGASYKPMSVTPDQAQFLQTRQFQRSEIAMIYGVPPHMIGDVERSTSWGSGLEQQSIGFIRYTLRPYIKRIESALTRLLPEGQFLRFDLTDMLQADTLTRFQAYLIARNGGWLSIDDIRQKENMPNVPIVGDDHILPLNSGLKSDFAAALLTASDPSAANPTNPLLPILVSE